MNDPHAVNVSPRRKFLQGAALAATGAATLGFPMVAKAQGPISMRWQSTWPQKDIFHEYALDFAKKVNDMTGGDLKIEVLPAGAVVPKSSADRGGLEAGDVILQINELAVVTREALREALADAGLEAPLRLTVRRGGNRLSLVLKAPAA